MTPVSMPSMPQTTAPAIQNNADMQRPGRSGAAPGQLAKQAVAAAREAGIEVPKNAQGLAASQIAKGADPASLFNLQVVDDGASPDNTEIDLTEESADMPDVGIAAVAGYDAAAEALGAGAVTSQDIALELLA